MAIQDTGEFCNYGSVPRPCYGKPITEADRQRGFNQEQYHDQTVRQHLATYTRQQKRQLRANLHIPHDKPLLTHNPRTHVPGVDHEMGILAWDDVYRSGPMWSSDAQRKAAKYKERHKLRYVVSNAPQLRGQLNPLHQAHAELVDIAAILTLIDRLSEPITSVRGCIEGIDWIEYDSMLSMCSMSKEAEGLPPISSHMGNVFVSSEDCLVVPPSWPNCPIHEYCDGNCRPSWQNSSGRKTDFK